MSARITAPVHRHGGAAARGGQPPAGRGAADQVAPASSGPPTERAGDSLAPFTRFAAMCALAAAAANLGYSISFLVVRPDNPDSGGTLASIFLMLGGLVSLPAVVALYRRVRAVEPGFAQWALILATAGALGATIHGAYDLANAINPPPEGVPDLPSQIDPRGLLTFGSSGAGLLAFAWLIAHGSDLPRRLALLGVALGVLLLAVYVLRLVVLEADSVAIVVPAALTGFVVSPLWYVALGRALLRPPQPFTSTAPSS